MKKMLFLLCFCMATTAVFAITKDSIIVNVGSRKKVVLYGETKEDLKNLEKIDLNKALKNMNKEMDLMNSKTRRLVVKDYNGNSYSIDSADVHQSPWQKFVKNTYFNLYLGRVTSANWSRDASTTNPAGMLTYQHMTSTASFYEFSPHYGLSWMHSSRKILNNRVAFNLKKGLRYDYSHIKTLGLVTQPLGEARFREYISSSKKNGGYMAYYDDKTVESIAALVAKYETVKSTTTVDREEFFNLKSTTNFIDGTKLTTGYYPSRNWIHRLSFDFVPTFSLLNKKKQDTFTLGVGLYASKIFLQRQSSYQYLKEANFLYGEAKQNTNFGDATLGIHLSAGYKNISFFMRSDIVSNRGLAGNQIFDNKGVDLVPVQGQFRMSTIGIKIGR